MEELGQIQSQAEISNEVWSVVVLYQDKPTRDRAMVFCDQLVRKYWSEVEFEFHWWRLDFLADAPLARRAAAEARTADLFVFSAEPEGELSPAVRSWFESWCAEREPSAGLLLDLTASDGPPQPWRQPKQAALQELARVAGLDYFSQLPPAWSAPEARAWRDVEVRAREVSAVLDGILNRLPPPSHFGLNE